LNADVSGFAFASAPVGKTPARFNFFTKEY
jgi:hypothetical protein